MGKKWAKTIELVCDGCGKQFTRSLRAHNKWLAKGRTHIYCKVGCFPPKKLNDCAHCGKPTPNPKYCSSSCAASVNGSLYPKKSNHRKERTCYVCESSYFNSETHRSHRMCPECFEHYKNGTADKSAKLGSIAKAKSLKNKHPSWKFAYVRILNRKWNKHMLKLPCAKCSYSIHVELAHIKSMASFPMSATLGEVNDPSNVIQFCRNCHWEFDHHIFTLEDLPRIELGSTA